MKKVLAMFLSVCFIATAFLCVPATAASPASDIIGIRPKTYLWTKDITSLKATVIYDNQLEDASLLVTCAQYDKDGKLLSATPQTFPVSKGENKTLDVSVPVNKKATDAKFFAWASDDTYAPATSQAELSKVTSGELVYVDVNYTGSSQNGSFKFPYQTVEAALSKKVKTYLNYSNPPETIYVILKSGEYIDADYEPLTLTSDYYSDDTEVIFTSLEGEKAAFSGALRVEGFEDANDDGIYEAQVSKVNGAYPLSRQLFVNGIKATRARSKEDEFVVQNLDKEDYNEQKKAAGNSDDFTDYEYHDYGLTSDDQRFLEFADNAQNLELHFMEKWFYCIVRPESITSTSDGKVSIKFNAENEGELPVWQALITSNNSNNPKLVYIENALGLIDEPGEYYYDEEHGKLYYMPRSFENIETAEVIMPVAEQLLVMQGRCYEDKFKAKNVSLKNLDFKYTTWNYPTTHKGAMFGQGGQIRKMLEVNKAVMIDGGNGMGMTMPGAVTLFDVSDITVEGCDFTKIGSQALKVTGAVKNCKIIGNEFYDLSGAAITLGDTYQAKSDEHHRNFNHDMDPAYVKGNANSFSTSPVRPNPNAAVTMLQESNNEGILHYYEGAVIDNEISNNYIHKIATDYYSAPGIGVGFPINTTIRNNEITDCTSCGIHTGGGGDTTPTRQYNILNNYFHNIFNWRLSDGAPIYSFGATGGGVDKAFDEFNTKLEEGKEPATLLEEYAQIDPWNRIDGNYIKDSKNSHGGIYPDEFSNYYEITNNVVDLVNYPKGNSIAGYQETLYWLHIWTDSINTITAIDNYSAFDHSLIGQKKANGSLLLPNGVNMKNNGINCTVENTKYFSSAEDFPPAAKDIINNAGIEPEYRYLFDFGMQSINVPNDFALSNSSETLSFDVISSKDRPVNVEKLELDWKSTNSSVATVSELKTQDGKIQCTLQKGTEKGISWITVITTMKNDEEKVIYYDEFMFPVEVSQ